MNRPRRDIEASLLAKGFQKREGDHHYFVYWTSDGRKSPLFTKTSHNMRDIGDELLGRMAKQCGITKKEFLQLVDCPMSRAQYEAALTTYDRL